LKNEITQKLRAQLAHLSDDQMQGLIEQAKQVRKESHERETTLDTWVLRLYKKQQRSFQAAEDVREGTVGSVYPTQALVHFGEQTELVRVTTSVCVGDQVRVGRLGSDLTIIEVLPRRSWLSRPEVGNAQRAQYFAVNLDVVMIVVSVVSPPLHPRLIDRYLIATQNGHARPVIAVNKIDLLTDHAELSVLDVYRENGVPVHPVSTANQSGIAELREAVRGLRVAFVGHSGVGKSSLINAFAPELGLNTGDVSHGYGRGTHTTTVSSLHPLSDGTVLIDTPGIRSFGIGRVSESEVLAAFPEFAGRTCRFRNCTHESEPGCEVLAAVESGEVPKARYDAYMRLREEVGA
jgi:ribosome biogenesis GTPase / thiamine phosphate phosphatase